MAAIFSLRSGHRFIMTPEMSPTKNFSHRSPPFLANSCSWLRDGQTISNLSAIRQTNRATLPCHFTTFHSFAISNPMKISVSPAPENHQVFFNYRGEQLGNSFVSHLSNAFERHQIKFFIDKDEQRGKDLKHLFERIEESTIALAIFSTGYPESRWCMDELVKMKKLADQGKLLVIPIFYKVEAGDVRNQTGEFGDKFWTLAKASSGDDIKNWKEALECISDKMGLSFGDKSSEADFVKEIVKAVERIIAATGVEEEENSFCNAAR